MKRRPRQLLVGLAAVALLATTGAAGIHFAGAQVPVPVAGGGELPGALGAHNQKLLRAVPGSDGMAPDGPGVAAQQEFLERAYPASAITVEQVDRSKAAYAAAEKRVASNQRGGGAARQWTNIGPSEALYPATEFRNAFASYSTTLVRRWNISTVNPANDAPAPPVGSV